MGEDLKKTVLVVDDEDDVRKYLSQALEDAGFTVITASDGNEALRVVKKNPPDIISLDLVMPKKSGARFHRELSKNDQWSKIPVLIVTGHARDDLGKADLRDLTISGPGIYLEKPVKPHNYIAAIKKLLGMDTNAEERELADKIEMQSNLKTMIDDADPETLRLLKQMLNEKKDG